METLFIPLLSELLHQTGLSDITPGNLVMIMTGLILLYLGIVKKYEPFLLTGIGFSCIVANVPGSTLTTEGGLFWYAYQGVEKLILPPLIFLGVGAMTDFGPMIANPSLVISGCSCSPWHFRCPHRCQHSWLLFRRICFYRHYWWS